MVSVYFVFVCEIILFFLLHKYGCYQHLLRRISFELVQSAIEQLFIGSQCFKLLPEWSQILSDTEHWYLYRYLSHISPKFMVLKAFFSHLFVASASAGRDSATRSSETCPDHFHACHRVPSDVLMYETNRTSSKEPCEVILGSLKSRWTD
jgi:hypothetical protein